MSQPPPFEEYDEEPTLIRFQPIARWSCRVALVVGFLCIGIGLAPRPAARASAPVTTTTATDGQVVTTTSPDTASLAAWLMTIPTPAAMAAFGYFFSKWKPEIKINLSVEPSTRKVLLAVARAATGEQHQDDRED